ncbi:HPr-rel-A system PqqD family peptide chaperone [Micromonospora sagamiensis]|uniref:PqqD family protein of HPr-rel-A system n=1 Tax=Micromonospora sagamiensis TaxID=47875 RepID=A0A562WJ30_9ACTN|nr:HPr-rel-A system PqqD family peptide chaperone [Micromonospora sagamiensis]TWJ30303.1 PqqD family protein of HPr-rel-A system [Micromonospora sagamiensis]BCL16667.1 hypothetical protein GCM10017556_44060 [Micromonospora sagamiensis]
MQNFAIADHVVCRQTNTDLRMLFDRQKGVMYELNETASSVVAILERSATTAEQISEELSEEFDAPRDEIRASVDEMLSDFENAGLVIRQ